MKRKLTLFLSAVMAASSLPMTAYAANFKDINDVAWASTVINSVADKGLLSGYNDNTFRGKNNVTYCEAMQMVYTTLTKSGAAASMDTASVYGYMQSLDTLNIPQWAQMAVAYGLSAGIIDMQMVATKFAGGQTAATREDVAIIFGNAMGYVFGKERDTSGAQSFLDYWNISVNALEQVSMLKKMGVIKGDTYNRFNPKHNINRAEMAVMVSNTFDLLVDGTGYRGEIIELNKNTGNDGTNYYYIAIRTEEGYTEGFSVTEGKVPVYVGDTSEEMSMSRLAKGDDVVFMISGKDLVAIRMLDGITEQEKYNVTGYVDSIKGNELSLENENTNKITKYTLDTETVCYVEGEKVNRKNLGDIMKENDDNYAYAGLITEVKREKENGQYINVTYVKELHITFTKDYSVVGTVNKFTETNIVVDLEENSARKTFMYADGCKYYVADEAVDFEEAKTMVKSGTTYAKVTVNANDKATSVILSEDSFAREKELEESKSYKLISLTDKKMVLDDGGEKITYTFGSTHPLENIDFYVWDKGDVNDKNDDDWEEVKDVDAAIKKIDDDWWKNSEDNVYVRTTFNTGGKLKEIYLSDVRTAWKNSKDHQTERKGTVASLVDDILKFETSAIEYKMLKSYDNGDLKNSSALSNSKVMLARMANDSDLELYAEIEANGDNEVTKINAYLKAAEGKLVEFHNEKEDKDDDYYVEIETKDGNVIKIASHRSPKLTDEEEDVFELEDIAGPNSKYIGENVILGFTAKGVVNEITVENGAKSSSISNTVKGIAVAADDGLRFEDDDTTYRWKSKSAEIVVRNYSGSTESITTIKRMIEDPDVEVYVEAKLHDSTKGDMIVNSIKVYVRSAEGTLKELDGKKVRITTDAGNTFTFDAKAKLDTCDVDGYGQKDVEERGKGVGTYVELTFEDDGDVCGIESK